ncbi:helix-turn-helix transcriptional regulator [Devosia sp. BK]|uniref:helix-turn-helix transcriptional regulator n=1 Tax=Devosia sp. BK TaxID=2871706 RepID=UPI00293C0D80|nr:helix-turn-helix domain-containing protein [Devosia sp. BK]
MLDPFARIRAARGALGMSQAQLAREAGVHRNTVAAIEQGATIYVAMLLACQHALERHGVEFLEISGRLGVILPPKTSRGSQMLAARVGMTLDQRKFGRLAGIDRQTVGNVEKDSDSIAVDTIALCLKVLSDLDVVLLDLDARPAVLFPKSSVRK